MFQAFKAVGVVNNMQYQIYYMGYLMLCICLTWDLNKTIVNPLYPAKKRLRWYLLWVILSIVILLGSEAIYFSMLPPLQPAPGSAESKIPEAQFLRMATFQSTSKWKVGLLIPLGLFLIIGIHSCYKAW